MKIYISADIEGVAGIVSSQQCQSGNGEYERARMLMTKEVNAAVSGAFEAGASEVFVNDSHGSMVNLIAEELHPDARIIQGKPKLYNMAAGLNDSFDQMFLVGHHSAAGMNGVLAHTTNGRAFRSVLINDIPMGEPAIYGAFAGELGIPVTLITGDDYTRQQNMEYFIGAEFVVVKEAMGNRAACSLSPVKAQALIRKSAYSAVKQNGKVKPFEITAPFIVKFVVFSPVLADQVMHVPPAIRFDGVTVGFECKSMSETIGWMSMISALSFSVL